MAKISDSDVKVLLHSAAPLCYEDDERIMRDEDAAMQISEKTNDKILNAIRGKAMTKKRRISLIMKIAAVSAAVVTLAACASVEPLREMLAGVLTDIFSGEEMTISEEYTVVTSIEPLYDAETGVLTFVCSTDSQQENENGEIVYGQMYKQIRVLADGTNVSELTLGFIEERYYLYEGAQSEDKVVLLLEDSDALYGESYYGGLIYEKLFRSYQNGAVTDSEYINDYIEGAHINEMVIDGEGNIVISTLDTPMIIGFGAQYDHLFTLDTFSGKLAVRSGVVYNDNKPIVDGQFGEVSDLPDGSTVQNYHFTDDGCAYVETNDGLYLYADGAEPERIMSFENSNLNVNRVKILKVLDRENLLILEDETISLYTVAPDVDLDETVIIDLAYVTDFHIIDSYIVEFNKANPGIRIVSKQYESNDALMIDIMTGVYQPDIVTNSWDNTIIEKLITDGLYTDLYPLIDASENLERDDIYGAVKRTYEMEDGTLSAICGSFQVNSLLGRKDVLGDRTSWTVSEMLDFAATLPEDAMLFHNESQETLASFIFGDYGYSAFVDVKNGTASFENEEFYDYLAYLKTLPEETDHEIYGNKLKRWEGYTNGKLILAKLQYMSISAYMQEQGVFFTEDYVRIGYPSGGSFAGGSYITANPYVITSFCENPTEAWYFIEYILFTESNPEVSDMPEFMTINSNFPTLKSSMENLYELHYDCILEYMPNGMSTIGMMPEKFIPNDPNSLLLYFTEEDAAELTQWLDNDVGVRMGTTVPQEISDIVDEEISAYLADQITAEECGERIQSRVEIWLSERE